MTDDPDATERYRELVAAMLDRAERELRGGLTPYQVAVLSLSPAFRYPDEAKVVVLEA